MPRSFADPETEFELETSDTGYGGVGDARYGEPTGMVRCVRCGRSATNVDEIPHSADCPQRFVRSGWWADHLRDD